MNKHTISRNILIAQMLVSTIALGFIIYYIYPFIENNKELMGTYYALTTILSFFIGLAVEKIMLCLFDFKKEKAKKEAIESTPTTEHEAYKNQLIIKEKNKKIINYKDNFDI